MATLKCSKAEIERGRRVGEFRGQEPDPYSVVDVRRWMAKVGEAVDDLVTIVKGGCHETGRIAWYSLLPGAVQGAG